MVAKIRVDYDDKGAAEGFDDVADSADRANKSLDKTKEGMKEAEAASKSAADASAKLNERFRQIAVAAAAAFSVTKIKEYIDAYNLMADAIIGAQIETGLHRVELDRLARQLQVASSNSLSYTEALQQLSAGASTAKISTQEMADAIEYATLRAKSLGQDTKTVAEQVKTALVAASAETLAQLGLLPDGIDAVRHSYDRLHDEVGLFDKLSEEQRKMEVRLQALVVMRDRTEDFKALGLEGQNSIDRLTGSVNNLNDAIATLVAGGRLQVYLADASDIIDTGLIPAVKGAIDTFFAAADAITLMYAGLQDLNDWVVPDWVEDFLGVDYSQTADDIRQIVEETNKEAAAIDERAKKAVEAQDKVVDKVAEERKTRAELAAENQRWHDERVKQLAEQEAAQKAVEQATKEQEEAERELARQRAERAKEVERQQKEEAERTRELAKVAEEQARAERKRIDTLIRGFGDLDQSRQQATGGASGGDGAATPNPQGPGQQQPNFGGPLGGIFSGLLGMQQGRFANAQAQFGRGVFGGGGGGQPQGGGFGGDGQMQGEKSGPQQIIDKILAGIDEQDIKEQVVKARIAALQEERDAMLKGIKDSPLPIDDKINAIKGVRGEFEREDRQIRKDVFRRGDISNEDRQGAVNELIGKQTEVLGQQAGVSKDMIKALAENAQQTAEQGLTAEQNKQMIKSILDVLAGSKRAKAQIRSR